MCGSVSIAVIPDVRSVFLGCTENGKSNTRVIVSNDSPATPHIPSKQRTRILTLTTH
jgi:hypothetical protein